MLAPDIVKLIGEHKAYYEPFCGSAAVLFAKPIVSFETINDLHGDVINLAMVLASDRWIELHRKVDSFLISEGLLEHASRSVNPNYLPPADPRAVSRKHVEQAALFVAASWMARNGACGCDRIKYQMAVRWTQGGGSPGIRWRSAVDSVPYWHDRLKGVVILNRNGFDIVERIADEEGTVIYCDPPYLGARLLNHGSRYAHEFSVAKDLFGAKDDHERLAAELGRFRHARVLVSYYEHERLDELYPPTSWHKIGFGMPKMLARQNKRGTDTTQAPEVVLTNFRPDQMDDPRYQRSE